MSKSVSPAWIANYLIDVAQEHGANTSAIKVCKQKKKVQVIGILHYGSTNLDEDSIIWAVVSDKKHHIPVKFSQESIAKYRRDNNERFTENKTSLITLQQYRLIHTRIPVVGPSKLSAEPRLALDCTEFCLIGSCGEDVWENPKAVEDSVSDVKEWAAGLRKGGGEGNVLKDRVNVTEQKSCERQVKIMLPEGHGSPSPQPQPDARRKEASSIKGYASISKGKGKMKEVTEDTFARKRERRWETFNPLDPGSSQPAQPPLDQAPVEHSKKDKDSTGTASQAEPDETFLIESWPSQQATPPPSEPDHLPSRDRDRSATPLEEWSNTDDEEEQGEAPVLESSSQPTRSSPSPPQPPSLTAPTPAQRRRVHIPPTQDIHPIDTEEESGLPIVSSPEMPKDLHSDDRERPSVSPVKFSIPSSLVSHVPGTQTVAYLSSSFDMGMNVRRRVPPPRQPVDLPRSERPVVLAPPSDTSGSQEQSQGRSQGWGDELSKETNLEHDAEDKAGSQNESRRVERQPQQIQQPQLPINVNPAPAAAKIKPNEELIIPETQPDCSQSEVRHEDEVEVGDTRTEECSMVVHPGTFALPNVDAEGQEEEDEEDDLGDQPRDEHDKSVDRVSRQRLYRHAKTEISQRYPKGAGEVQAGHEVDDEQTLESLFGAGRGGVEALYDPAEWVKPSFMGSCEARKKVHQDQRSAVAASSSSRRSRREDIGAAVPAQPRIQTHDHNDISTAISKPKKRARTDAFDDIEHVSEHVARFKRTRVEHDAGPARGCHDSTEGRRKLNGFSLNLEGMKADEPWKMSWERLGTILLKTGRERVQRLKK
ncbi:hypothetical protein AAF712_004051 [Marasmius tenuissimus]|uniref:Shelterin complex subunit TPP1/Est3 domain-containing protein n=1 Tax=Marasmius tenuissimus TaxID=585030 RepID=A0ABR3A5P7_9AGAR